MKRLIKLSLAALLVSTVVCGLWVITFAAVPHLINYQGRLTDKDNKPLEGAYSLTFRIYDAETAGNLLWQETQSSVVIQKGVFSVLLGAVTDLNLAFDIPYFLEIKVGEEVMSPRQRITSAGYAITAENTLSISRGVIVMWSGSIADIPTGWALCDGTNGTPDLRNRFIVGAQEDSGGVTKTNVSGSLVQIGGEAAHTLTIAEMPAHAHLEGIGAYGAGDSNGYAEPPYNSRFLAWSSDTTASTGGGGAHNNLPPYYALAYIMKL